MLLEGGKIWRAKAGNGCRDLDYRTPQPFPHQEPASEMEQRLLDLSGVAYAHFLGLEGLKGAVEVLSTTILVLVCQEEPNNSAVEIQPFCC